MKQTTPIMLRLTQPPPLAVDAGLVVLVGIITLGQILISNRPHDARFTTEIILASLGIAALLPRGRYPVASLLAVTIFSVIYVGFGYPWTVILPAVVVAIYTVVAYSPRGRLTVWLLAAGVTALLCLALFVIDTIPRGHDRPPFLWLSDFAWILFAVLLGDSMRSRREADEEAVAFAHQAQLTREEEARRKITEERLEIARELHDIVAHNLALINVQAAVAAHVMDTNPEQAREAFAHIKTASHTALQELRSLLRVLRDPATGLSLTPTHGLEALDDLIAGVREADLQVDLDVRHQPGQLPATVDLAAYRILQEALTNVMKHAPHAHVQVVVDSVSNGGLLLQVTNGPGSEPAARTNDIGSGLAGMRERVSALGGTLDAGPLPGGGFCVEAHIPAGSA